MKYLTVACCLSFIPYNVTFALTKAYTFAFIISGIPAYYGYNVKGGALEIGQSSTSAVVTSCVAILLADYVIGSINAIINRKETKNQSNQNT